MLFVSSVIGPSRIGTLFGGVDRASTSTFNEKDGTGQATYRKDPISFHDSWIDANDRTREEERLLDYIRPDSWYQCLRE
jgi:hypothetical protein